MKDLADPWSSLSRVERGRHERLRMPVDRDDFVAARVAARRLVLAYDGAETTRESMQAVRFEQHCPTCGGPHGPPRIVGRDDLFVSWAHAKGVVAAAVAECPVGIDVERIGAEPPPGLRGEGVLPWLTWTRVEAVTKLGLADLDTALSWAPLLAHPSATRERVNLPAGPVVLTDHCDTRLNVVASLATPARKTGE
ncbi:hypothetical protein [Demetria terragena]|uniref:hypothetical protein n=1 Tax=Demetria terragena TaxID=63959 RepID=UPI000369BCB2|nr:hypothetical protein [Demetria terragena]